MAKVFRVFVSYSREEQSHNEFVMKLAADLRRNGVDASLDEWDLIPGQDMTLFMESQIRDSDYVVLICTLPYAQKSNIPRGGVGYEKNIISAEMLQASDLRPKFIPILREGTFEDALPTYLGSKYVIDFRESRNYQHALEELLRAIHKQPHPQKPPLGRSPFETESKPIEADIGLPTPVEEVQIGQDIDTWEKEAKGRFDYLRSTKIDQDKEDPFQSGFWQGSFVLTGFMSSIGLKDFLEVLRDSETGRTGWDIGWVPTRSEIAPYPYKDGIEVWLAESGDKGSAYSDFWRAEPTGRFSLFRGYQEDGREFQAKHPGKLLAFSLMLWRVTEFLLYVESFAHHLKVPSAKATIKFSWYGLENRTIYYHKGFGDIYRNHVCCQDSAHSRYVIENCANIKTSLIHDVCRITAPLFEVFGFFHITEQQVKDHVKDLFDPDQELLD
jgi:hypothetical protein